MISGVKEKQRLRVIQARRSFCLFKIQMWQGTEKSIYFRNNIPRPNGMAIDNSIRRR